MVIFFIWQLEKAIYIQGILCYTGISLYRVISYRQNGLLPALHNSFPAKPEAGPLKEPYSEADVQVIWSECITP